MRIRVMVIRLVGVLNVSSSNIGIFGRGCDVSVSITILKTIFIKILLFWNHFVLLLDC